MHCDYSDKRQWKRREHVASPDVLWAAEQLFIQFGPAKPVLYRGFLWLNLHADCSFKRNMERIRIRVCWDRRLWQHDYKLSEHDAFAESGV